MAFMAVWREVRAGPGEEFGEDASFSAAASSRASVMFTSSTNEMKDKRPLEIRGQVSCVDSGNQAWYTATYTAREVKDLSLPFLQDWKIDEYQITLDLT